MREVEKISEKMVSLRLEDGLKFKQLDGWMFPDGFITTKKDFSFSEFIGLYKGEKPIAIINFSLFPSDFKGDSKKTIRINFLQGVLQPKDGFNFKSLKKPWYDIFLASFIKSSQEYINKGFKFVFTPLEGYNRKGLLNEYRAYSLNIKKISKKIEILNKNIEKIKNIKKNLEKNISVEKRNLDKKYQRIIDLEKRYEYDLKDSKLSLKKFKTELRNVEHTLKNIGMLRDRYFTKDGNLNFNKKRVKEIINIYQEYQKRKNLGVKKKSKLFKPFKKR